MTVRLTHHTYIDIEVIIPGLSAVYTLQPKICAINSSSLLFAEAPPVAITRSGGLGIPILSECARIDKNCPSTTALT